MQVPKASGGDRRSDSFKNDSGVLFETKTETIKKAGFTPKQVQRFETLAKNPDIVEQAKAEARENDEIKAIDANYRYEDIILIEQAVY